MSRTHSVDVCIVGGGPAGMVLGLLLAAKGVKVLVLEKNQDFSREYRGEVLMPRFTQMLRQIGLESWLNTLPSLKLKHGEIFFRNKPIGKLDFSKAAPDTPYELWMPQTVLLKALHEQAKRFPNFEIWFGLQFQGPRTTKILLRSYYRQNEATCFFQNIPTLFKLGFW